MDPVSDDSGCASEVSSDQSRSPTPELVKPTLPEVVAPPTPPPQPKAAMKIEPEKKAAPKKVIAPTVVPNRGPGRNSLIDERMKARRQSFVKPVTKKSEEEFDPKQTVFEAPKWDDIEEEPPKKTEQKPIVEQKSTEQKSTERKPTEQKISVSQNKPNITKITQNNKPQQITKIQQNSSRSSNSSPALQRRNIQQEPEEVKPEVDLSQSFNETLKSSDSKKPALAKFKLPELSQDIGKFVEKIYVRLFTSHFRHVFLPEH